MLYLYDPKTNILTPTDYTSLEGITGSSRSTLMKAKSKGGKLRTIDCYIVDEDITRQQRYEWYSQVTFPDEYWKVIDGSDNHFKVSNYGRVKRIYKRGAERYMMPYPRKQANNLLHVKCRFQGKYKDHAIHRLVAHHFIGPCPEGMRVYHKNNIKTDNYAGNLTYITPVELGKKTGFRSSSRPVAKLDPTTGEVIEEYRSAREAGRKNFLSDSAVLDSCHNRWKIYDFKFAFVDEIESSKELEGAT